MGSAVKCEEAVRVTWTAVEDLESWRTKAGTSPGFETQLVQRVNDEDRAGQQL